MSIESRPPLAYAVDDGDGLRRRVRLTLAWVAVGYGSLLLVIYLWSGLTVAGLFDGGVNFGRPDVHFWLQQAVYSIGSATMITGGFLLVRRRGRLGLWLIRIAALAITLHGLGETTFNIAIHMGVLPSQPAAGWRTIIYDISSRLTWVFDTPAVLFLFSLTLRPGLASDGD